MHTEKITSFEQLHSWQKSADLAKQIYAATKKFPAAEKFALTDQLQRSAVSVSANIAEGFGRSSAADKLHFYTIAYGSLLETKSHLLIAHRIGYIDELELDSLLVTITDVQKLILGSRKALKNHA